MTGRTWKNVSELVRSSINMSTSPVAVSLLKDAGSLLDLPNVTMVTNTALCHMIARAKYHEKEGILGASAQGIKCIWADAALGLIRTPQRLADGELNRDFVRDAPAGRRLQESMYMLGDSEARYGSVVVSPLDLTPVEPGAIVLYVSPAQALRLIIAFAYENGESVVTEMTGQASVCCAIAKAVGKGQVTVDIPCIGDRAFGLAGENDIIVAFPPTKIDQLIDGLRGTERSASYPFKPFMRWPVIFPPEMEPRRPELE
ncbi:MAG TPA: DUF169 domain-containing protein [Methanomassiliicoccales archaeon]